MTLTITIGSDGERIEVEDRDSGRSLTHVDPTEDFWSWTDSALVDFINSQLSTAGFDQTASSSDIPTDPYTEIQNASNMAELKDALTGQSGSNPGIGRRGSR